MLLLIGAIGLLVAIYRYRLPGVPFLSVVTVFNRKQKLTPTGSTVYLVFFVVAILGLLMRFAGNVPAERSAEEDGGGPAAVTAEAEESNYWRENVEKMVLARRALLSVLLVAPEMADVRSRIDRCEEAFRRGTENDKQNDRSSSTEQAVKACGRTAAQLCYSWPDPDRLEPTQACQQLRASDPGLWSSIH